MFAHGVLSALFFAVVGVVYDRAHTRDMALFQGLARRMGKTAGLFTVVGLASLALPGTSSFVAELLVILGAFGRALELAGQPLALLYLAAGVAGVVGALITAVYILRMLTRVFFGPLDSRWQGMTDAGPREALAAGLLVAAILTVGLFPFPFLRVIDGGLEVILPLFRGGGG
jgi:NADH-quinone oxidoreductase subunit M